MHTPPLPVHHSALSLLHAPPHEILSGVAQEYFESPSRYNIILDALTAAPDDYVARPLKGAVDADWVRTFAGSVHGHDYLNFLETIYDRWCAEGGSKDAALPETFLRSDMLLESDGGGKDGDGAIPTIGRFSFDLSAPVTEGTWSAAMASANVALAAAEDLATTSSAKGVFALCRPPGHHAAASLCGGYCFLNNAAIAARYLQSRSPSQDQKPKIAILDVDYHHGNGTSQIFYSDPSVLYVSLHGSPDYPYYTGAANERGVGAGVGANVNFPLPLGTGDAVYLETLVRACTCVSDWNADYLVISLGVDTFVDDPITDFGITLEKGYPNIGREIGRLNLPTLFVMEGGYNLEHLGMCVKAVLDGFRSSQI